MEAGLRKTLRGQLTRHINAASNILSAAEVTSEKVDEVHILISRIKDTNEKLNQVNEKVMSSAENTEYESEWEKILEYDDTAETTILRLERWLLRHDSSALEVCTQQSNGSRSPVADADDVPEAVAVLQPVAGRAMEHSTETGNISQNRMTVRLPKLELKKFNGNLSNWPSFWEQYKSVIHQNKDLDDRDKFNYLQSVLVDKAALTISGLVPSENCYKDAIEMLTNEYGNSAKIVDSYIKKLMALAPVKNKNDVVALRRLYNSILSITRSLQSLGVSATQYGLMVKSIILKAIPYNMCVEFNKLLNYDSDNSDLDSNVGSDENYEKQINKLLKFIKLEVESVEHAQSLTGSELRLNEAKANYSFNKKSAGKSNDVCSASGLLTTAKNSCLFCASISHKTINCEGSQKTISERKDILKRNKCCFRCTFPNHTSKYCRTSKLYCKTCRGRHASSMCDPGFQRSETKNVANVGEGSTNTTNLLTGGQLGHVYLQTACAFMFANDNNHQSFVRFVIDGGSQLTFIRESISRRLKLTVIGNHKLSICSFGSKQRSPARDCNRVLVKLQGQYPSEVIEIQAIEVPEICLDNLKPPTSADPALSGLNLADTSSMSGPKPIEGISMLIGADNYWKVVTGEFLKVREGLMAVNTKFGWTLHGPGDSCSYNVEVNLATVLKVDTFEDDSVIQRFWDLETIGIGPINNECVQNSTVDFINDKIDFNGDRYVVQLPWKDSNQQIDDNYDGALKRVKTLTSRLIKQSKLEEYDNAVRDYLRNDCAEKVSDVANEQKLYYMPHKPIYREDKSTKIRVVFDASAHAPGLSSLNDHLSPGENLVPELLKVLLNFRLHSIGISADIEKAFLQIELDEDDRDSHSFLWYDKPANSPKCLPEITKYRMKRVTFGVTCSPFLLAATLKKHLAAQQAKFDEICDILSQSFYVDDLVVSVNSFEMGKRLYNTSRLILSSAKMNLRKWHTNDALLVKEISDLNTSCTETKVLGILWNTVNDELSTDLTPIMKTENSTGATKRNVLREVSKIFDPLGMLTPFTVRAKILMQDIWKRNIDWDAILPPEIDAEWKAWCSEINILEDFVIPRWLGSDVTKNVELHIFADASPKAFGAVAYVRGSSNNEVNCTFLMAKGRIAPISKKSENQLTLPKLELTACVCACRLLNYLQKNVYDKFDQVILWSDSKVALYWIEGDPAKWKPYVANRVKEIQSTSKGLWKHCPGKDNPADLLTRGVKAKSLLDSTLWKKGPDWLAEDEENWPVEEYVYPTDEISTLVVVKPIKNVDEAIFSAAKYDNFEKTLRITAYVLRFVHNLRNPKNKVLNVLMTAEIKQAEIYWIKFVQKMNYAAEIADLTKKRPLDLKSNILTLNPFLDENGIMRVGGRLQRSTLPYDTYHPIVIPNKSLITEMIIWQSHFKMLHGGINATLSHIRKQFWIIRGRQRVKSVISSCLRCKRLKGKPGQEPFAPLPRDRIVPTTPFNVTGLDFAGPLYVVNANNQRVKVYIMLLTCAVTRAIHLELVPNLTTESCILAFRRFISRRGVPTTVYSDNAKTFKRVALELNKLSEALRSSKFQEFSLQQRIDWKFIAERASWWGGWWERLVRTVKDCLKSTLWRVTINAEEMETVLAEVEATINSRPLTYVGEDPDNLSILSPSHFLTLKKGQDTGLTVPFEATKITSSEMIQRWKSRMKTIQKFWERWSTEYLQQLRSAHHCNSVKSSKFNVGDMVILHDQNSPRLLWKLARVTRTYPGRDNKIRACEIRLANGSHTRRPIQLLYPLELEARPGEDVNTSPSRGTHATGTDEVLKLNGDGADKESKKERESEKTCGEFGQII